MACPCTAAMDTNAGLRSHVYPDWNPAMESLKPGSDALRLRSSPGTPSALNMRRSIPAQNDGPRPRRTTTRTSSGSDAPMAARPCHMLGVIALRRSGRASVTVATLPDTLSSSPALVRSALVTSVGSHRSGQQRQIPIVPHALAFALPLVAPPRPRSDTPLSLRIRWMNPYDRPVDAASDRILSPAP